MKWHTSSTRTITVESYVTVRSEWPAELSRMVSIEYNARGFRVVDGRSEWQYFADEIEAKKWADAIHSPNRLLRYNLHGQFNASNQTCALIKKTGARL